MTSDLSTTTAVVTGANRGLGAALVQSLLDRGAPHVYATAREPETLAATQDDDRVTALALDLSDQRQIAQAAAATENVSLLINNAGTAAFAPVLDAPRADIEHEFDTNVLGTLDLIRAFVPRLAPGASIVNILSLLSLAAMPGMGGYSASKAAAHSLTQALRPTLAERGVSVIGVYPGAIDTDMLAGVEMPKAAPRAVAEAILDAVLAGEEDVFPDPMAARMAEVWRGDPKAFEREFAAL